MEPSFEKLPEAVSLLHQRLDRIEALLKESKQLSNSDELLTIEGAAKYLDVSKATVYGYVHDQAIPHSKIRKRLYFSKKKLEAWIHDCRRKTLSEINASADGSVIRKRRSNG